MRRIINQSWTEIQSDPLLRNIFPDKPLIAFKKNLTLRNKLVCAKLTESDTTSDAIDPTQLRVTNLLPQANRDPNEPFYGFVEPPSIRQQKYYPYSLFPKRKLVKSCFKPNCNLCKQLNHTSNFVRSKANRRCFLVEPHGQPMHCLSTRVIYLIQCRVCRKQYVGQTTQPLKKRITDHLYKIRKKN